MGGRAKKRLISQTYRITSLAVQAIDDHLRYVVVDNSATIQHKIYDRKVVQARLTAVTNIRQMQRVLPRQQS